MRIFVFAIGGTGARVLTSLIMQFASGVRPKDSNGNHLAELSVVPIIVDPHESNDALLNVINLLNDYRDIRKKIHGDKNDATGFFSVKLETLNEIASQSGTGVDQFFFSMPHVSGSTFGKYININDMELPNKLMMEMLFSEEELTTYMKEGFYGSPNIGCVALNEFKQSKDFEAFRSAFDLSQDRIFFIGSIFGGTGAAGLPLLISSIRDLSHIDSSIGGNAGSAEAPIGALIVMPYFAIEKVANSPIDEDDFIIKTKSALRYYADNLNRYVNTIYYIADSDRPKAFENDPGKSDQKGNKAHIVEYIGATAVCDFISTPEEKLQTREDEYGRKVAVRTRFKQFSFEKESSQISFPEMPSATNALTMLPMMKFFLMKLYMEKHLLDCLDKTFAKNYEPKLDRSILIRELQSFFERYDRWVDEMRSHGSTAHNLSYFSLLDDRDYTNMFNGIESKKKTFGRKTLKISDVEAALNEVAQRYDKMQNQYQRWFTIANEAMEKAITDNLMTENY